MVLEASITFMHVNKPQGQIPGSQEGWHGWTAQFSTVLNRSFPGSTEDCLVKHNTHIKAHIIILNSTVEGVLKS